MKLLPLGRHGGLAYVNSGETCMTRQRIECGYILRVNVVIFFPNCVPAIQPTQWKRYSSKELIRSLSNSDLTRKIVKSSSHKDLVNSTVAWVCLIGYCGSCAEVAAVWRLLVSIFADLFSQHKLFHKISRRASTDLLSYVHLM